MLYKSERELIITTLQRMVEVGLVINTAGNVSIKIDDHYIITPSGVAYEYLVPADILVMDGNKKIIEGDLLPSSETDLHYSLYESCKDAHAIVHTHSLYATAVSTITNELPAIHYQITDLGGPVPVASYETFGSPELAAAVTEKIAGKNAVLMQNHGAVTIGSNLKIALERSILLEWLSSLYLISLQSGQPSLIDDIKLKDAVLQKQKYMKLRQDTNKKS
jgi:L-fuculose-phosphate aldolase